MTQWAEIRHLHLVEGVSKKQIARRLQLDIKTVRRAVEQPTPPVRASSPRVRSLDPWREQTAQWLDQDRRVTAKRIRRLLLPLAGPVAARTVRRSVAARRAATSPKEGYVHRSVRPGTTMEVDFGESWAEVAGMPRKVKYLVATLPYSNVYFATAYPLERLESLLDGIESAFTYFGGVVDRVVLDNTSLAVKAVLAGRDRLETEAFAAFRGAYPFRAEFCAPAKGWEKGSVETGVKSVRNLVFRPRAATESWAALNALLITELEADLPTRHLDDGRSVQGVGARKQVSAYDRALVQRGDVTLWLTPEAIATWEAVGVGKRGGQLQYSEVAIETALTLRLIFHLPLRQTEGFLRSIFGMLCLDLSAPDHTTLSRRGQHLDLALRRLPAGAGIHLIVDSTGLSTVGEGEWAAVKHGGRGIRGWKKLHLGVDGSGVIVAHALTGGHVDDATTALDLIDKVEGDVSCLTADAAYDTRGIYEAAGARGATVVIPPTRTATVSGRRPRSPARDRTIRQVQQAGRRQWKKDSGYHQQARMENAFFRYKLIIGESLRARSRAGQETAAILACNILNQMTQLGRPTSYAIGR